MKNNAENRGASIAVVIKGENHMIQYEIKFHINVLK